MEKEELIKYIENDDYDGLLKSVDVNPGEFYPIYAGTVHAIGAGLTILEIQQSSDVTYRFYDYHRKDANGKERELHVNQAVSVTTYNSQELDRTNHLEQASHMVWDNEYFTVSMLNVSENEYRSKMNVCEILSKNNYSTICLWFGKDTFCQMLML